MSRRVPVMASARFDGGVTLELDEQTASSLFGFLLWTREQGFAAVARETVDGIVDAFAGVPGLQGGPPATATPKQPVVAVADLKAGDVFVDDGIRVEVEAVVVGANVYVVHGRGGVKRIFDRGALLVLEHMAARS